MKRSLYTLLICSVLSGTVLAQNVGVGTTTPAYKLDIYSDTLVRALNVLFEPTDTIGTLSALRVRNISESEGYNIGGMFYSSGTEGRSHGILSDVFTRGGSETFGLEARNLTSNIGGNTTTATRYGVLGEVYGVNNGAMVGVQGKISGQSSINRPATGVVGIVEEFATGGSSYAVRGLNMNGGFGGFFQGRTKIYGGTDANYTATSGHLILGIEGSTNLVLDDNEILARNGSSGSTLHLQADGGDLLICNQEAGSVGIGILSASSIPDGYLLAIDGKMICEELRVDLSGSWPDYVFQDDYERMSLYDLKRFIDLNQHLPNIPDARQMEERGIMVGDMQTRLMEKIEELTLYIIEVNEKVDRLEASIKSANK